MPGTEGFEANLALARTWLVHHQERLHYFRTTGRHAADAKYGLKYHTAAVCEWLDKVWESQEDLRSAIQHWRA